MAKGSVPFFKTMVARALIGIFLIGGTSAVLAARTVNEANVVQTTNAVMSHSSATSQTSTSKSTKKSTKTPTTSVGRTITLAGSVQSVSTANNTFTLVNRTGSHTIDVNSGTTFTGAASSLGGLRPGFDAWVIGTVQSNRSCLASQVSSDNGH
jgi:hypothetical protein